MIEDVKTEHEEQRDFVQWFRRNFPGVLIFAIPNGGSRSIVTATKLKAEGVTRGIPDLFIPAFKLFIEMKRVKYSSISEHQKKCFEYLKSVGYDVIVANGCDDAIIQTMETIKWNQS